jgi:hypothetical protein
VCTNKDLKDDDVKINDCIDNLAKDSLKIKTRKDAFEALFNKVNEEDNIYELNTDSYYVPASKNDLIFITIVLSNGDSFTTYYYGDKIDLLTNISTQSFNE